MTSVISEDLAMKFIQANIILVNLAKVWYEASSSYQDLKQKRDAIVRTFVEEDEKPKTAKSSPILLQMEYARAFRPVDRECCIARDAVFIAHNEYEIAKEALESIKAKIFALESSERNKVISRAKSLECLSK
jgi:hypothetical protein